MVRPRKPGKPKAKGKGNGKLKEAIILLPLSYNDGTKVPQEAIHSIQEELYLAFQGWTIEGTVQGAYRMKSGQKRVEELLKVAVVLDEVQIPQLEAMVARWGARLGQETMLLRIADSQIKFVPPQGEVE